MKKLFGFSYLKPALMGILVMTFSATTFAEHPKLVITKQGVSEMRAGVEAPGRFQSEYLAQKSRIDALIGTDIDVPVPKDGGGGYTHERHKKNYQLMFDAGVIYQISQDKKYADLVKGLLLEYADLYPTLDLHPKRKVKSQNAGKFFWQSLNEAVWLVHTIQAYDMVYDALSDKEREVIETNLLKPVSIFLSDGQPSTFDKIHNHGTWATAGVGMAGYVLNEPEWVEKALYGLDKSGTGGFLKQLDKLFSPQGYYNEGPYYQRYALMPFVTFGKAIENNQPERDIFGHRNGVLMKAIDTTIQLSYNGLFFPINDAIKSKGIDTYELVNGVTIAYGLTGDTGYLDIAKKQGKVILSGDGLKVADALDKGLATDYQFKTVAFGDGSEGTDGALVIQRSNMGGDQAVVFKPAAQGLGHGHFDKLTWQYYDHGNEIVSDYGAARFLNVEAKFGGRYLPENETYAKQTVAHNTVVVDEISHFNSDVKVGNANWPQMNFFGENDFGSVSSAFIDTAYKNVKLERTIALLEFEELDTTLVVDIFDVETNKPRQLDLPLHYLGQLIETNFPINSFTQELKALGTDNGFQHLWLRGQAKPEAGLAQVTWLNDNGRFYTVSSISDNTETFLFTQLGANDPNFNLRNEFGFIRRVTKEDLQDNQHSFISVLEPHGEYNPSAEYTLQASSRVSQLSMPNKADFTGEDLRLLEVNLAGQNYLVAINTLKDEASESSLYKQFSYKGVNYSFDGRLSIIELNK